MLSTIPSDLQQALRHAIATGHSELIDAFGKTLHKALEESRFADPLSLLYEKSAAPLFPTQLSGGPLDMTSWLIKAKEWVATYQEPGEKPPHNHVLYVIWSAFYDALRQQLQKSKEAGIAPSEGGVLAFAAGTSICVVFEYEFQGSIAELNPVAVIPDPRSLFDFWGTIDKLATPESQNALKKILSTGHKLVFHQGTLVHVDKRHEGKVFGPTIDTVILSEMLVQKVLHKRPNEIRTALEVGSGNGLLSAVLIKNNTALRELFAFDLDFSSVACTHKNCQLAKSTSRSQVTSWFINGPFHSAILQARVDLCICNPPYIPVPAREAILDRFSDNRRATGGTDLMELLVSSVDSMLSPTGALLLITSNLSLDRVKKQIPHNYTCEELLTGGLKVIFDVDAVVTDSEWLEFLIKEHGLISENGTYFHTLHPLIITRSHLK